MTSEAEAKRDRVFEQAADERGCDLPVFTERHGVEEGTVSTHRAQLSAVGRSIELLACPL
jgi:hypothetical protein